MPGASTTDRARRPHAWRPDPRTLVAAGAAAIVVAMAFVIAERAADEQRRGAMDAARDNVEAIVRGFVDPVLGADSLDVDAPTDPRIDTQLQRLTLSGGLRQITLWSRLGRAAYSSDAAIRGESISIDHELATAFAGESVVLLDGAGFNADGPALPGPASPSLGSAGPSPGGPSSVGVLRVLVPIRGVVDGNPIGVYDVVQDGRPIEARVESVRREVFLIAAGAMTALMVLLWVAFAATSRRLSSQNRLLRDHAELQDRLAIDLRRSEERFRSLVRNATDTVLILAADGAILYESPAVERVLGHLAGSRVGRPVIDLFHPDDAPIARRLVDDVRGEPGTEVTVELRAYHADGSARIVEAVARDLLDDPAVGGIVVNYRDVTERRKLEAELAHQAFHDRLTGLPNRALFLDRLQHAWSRAVRGRGELAVVFLDLDDFKGINDAQGHATGDEVLRVAAGRIVECLRAGDTVGRVGGDEFAVLLEDGTAEAESREVTERILARLREPFVVHGHEVILRASAGIAGAGTREAAALEEPDELLRNADIAMYQAKAQGKGRVATYEPSLRHATLGRLRLKADLQLGLERREFDVVYQPIVELRGGRVTGVEALLRWRHPRLGLVPPAEFIPLAEESGLIVPLGRWVLGEATRQARRWQAVLGRGIRVSVNLSARQISDPTLVADVRAALTGGGLAPVDLLLEITEGALVDDISTAVTTLEALRSLGVRLAIDDFGTGYSSLNYLRTLPVDVIKIDRSFVSELGRSDDQRALLRSIIELARTLHLDAIAEGVETTTQADELRALGVGLAQGFLFWPPMPPGSVVDAVRRSDAPRRLAPGRVVGRARARVIRAGARDVR